MKFAVTAVVQDVQVKYAIMHDHIHLTIRHFSQGRTIEVHIRIKRGSYASHYKLHM